MTDSGTEPLRVSRDLHAPRATVFRAWGSAQSVMQWFAPKPYTAPEAIVEMKPGGRFDVLMRSPAGETHWTRGRFVEIVPDRRLVIDMEVTDHAGNALFAAHTEIDFTDTLGGTRIDVLQSYTFHRPEYAARMVAGAERGWSGTLDNLEVEVVRAQGGVGVVARSVVHGTFTIERIYDAPRERVWAALTDENAKARWFGGPPGKWELIERVMEVRVGGRERLVGRWEGGVVSTFDAVYHDVIDGERLVYSYAMYLGEKKISVSLATFELAAAATGTRLTMTEQGAFLDGYDDAGSREHGSGFLLDALGASLAPH